MTAGAAASGLHWRAADLRCRPVAAGDAEALRALFDRPELAAWRHPAAADAADPAAAELDLDLAHWRREGMGRFAAFAGSALAGTCGLTRKPGIAGWNISYHLAAPYRGKGRATALACGLLRLAPLLTPPRRVFGVILPGDAASARVLARAGFAVQGAVDYGGRRATLWVAPTCAPG